MRFNPFVPHGPEPFTPTPKSGGPVLSTVEFFKRKIDELFRKDSTSVHYTREDKADEEKAIARDNIRAQEKLVSGVNLKTVRGQSLLGGGDIPQAPAEWGGIMGNLGMQTDLTDALGGKADKSNTYTKTETDTAIVANVENSVTSTSTTKALSAKMGRELQDQIQNLKQRGRYLSIWDCTTGLAKTEPTVNPYEYKAGDYFIVGTVAEEGGTNYRPSGTSYDKDVPSTTVETGSPIVNDTYYYDGTSWTLLHTEQPEISWGSVVGKPTTFPPKPHTHTKSEITDFPTEMPPTAHSHASDSWFTTAINSKADEAKPSFSTITINGVDYTEWTLGTRSGKIMLSVDMGGISTEIAAFNPVTGVFESAPSQYRDTLRFDGGAPVVGASPTLFDHVARESALSGKANISHTHTKSEITDFPTSMPPATHASSHSTGSSDAITPADIGAQKALPTTGAVHDTYAVNISGNAATATSIAEGSISKLWNSKSFANKYFVDVDGHIYSAKNTGGCYFQSQSGKKYYLSSTSSSESGGERVYEYSFTHETDPSLVMKYNSSTNRITQQWGNYRYGTIDNFNPFLSESIASIEFTGGGLTDYFSFTTALWQVSNSFVKTGAAQYSVSTSYTANQWVVYDGKLWVSKQPTRGNAPSGGSAHWADMSGMSSLFSGDNTSLMGIIDTHNEDSSAHSDIRNELNGKANSSDIPSLSGQTFDMSVDAQFKDMCIATARALGAVVTHTTDDTSTGSQVAQAYGITPTDATTFGELQTKAGLNDSDTLGDL